MKLIRSGEPDGNSSLSVTNSRSRTHKELKADLQRLWQPSLRPFVIITSVHKVGANTPAFRATGREKNHAAFTVVADKFFCACDAGRTFLKHVDRPRTDAGILSDLGLRLTKDKSSDSKHS